MSIKKQITVGITGGIGSGKTTIAKVFNTLGYPIYTADTRAKMLMVSNEELISDIKSLFGNEVYLNNGNINRELLAKIVFNDKEKLGKLNALVHPAVEKDFIHWCNQQKSSIVFKEAAILFEIGSYKKLDATILITASKEERIKRVIKRDKVTKEAVIARMNNQWPQEKKEALATYCINNEGNKLVIPQVLEVIDKLKTYI